MKYTLLQIIKDSTIVKVNEKVSNASSNIWLWVSVVEFGLILFLILRPRKKVINSTLSSDEVGVLNTSKSGEINMDDLMNNIHKSRDLYNALIRSCHPDRFRHINERHAEIADKLSQEITLNQRNYNRLVELKNIAEQELEITINI